MPSEGGRRGRRDNGLDAAAYVPLVDVDPRVGEHLLDVLGSAGVPAYLEPSADVEPYTRALSLPSPPTDRLWVDRAQRREALEIVDAETPHGTRPRPDAQEDEPSHGLADVDEERAWREIVAAWDAPAADPPRGGPPAGRGRAGVSPVPPWPAGDGPGAGIGEDGWEGADPWHGGTTRDAGRDHPADRDGRDGGTSRDASGDHPADRDGRDGGATPQAGLGGRPDGDEPPPRARPLPTAADLDREAEARARAEDDEIELVGPPQLDEGHYEPPPPPPVPRPSRQALLGTLVIAIGILLIAFPGLVGFDDRAGLTLGVFCVLGGGALLVLRLRDTRADDGPDDGAVV